MFNKILIANRGDNICEADVAVQAHAGAADVMPEPHCLVRAAHRGDLAAGAAHVCKILIANRGDNICEADVAVQAHAAQPT